MTKPPCKRDGKHCTRRYEGCHAECEDWAEYQRIHREEKDKMIKNKKIEDMANRVLINRKKRFRIT